MNDTTLLLLFIEFFFFSLSARLSYLFSYDLFISYLFISCFFFSDAPQFSIYSTPWNIFPFNIYTVMYIHYSMIYYIFSSNFFNKITKGFTYLNKGLDFKSAVLEWKVSIPNYLSQTIQNHVYVRFCDHDPSIYDLCRGGYCCRYDGDFYSLHDFYDCHDS